MVAMGTNVWINKAQCDDAERLYYEKLSGSVFVRKLFVLSSLHQDQTINILRFKRKKE